MIITKIEKSKKGNILLYADNNYLTSLSPEIFLKNQLKVGDYVDEDVLNKISTEYERFKAKEKALRLLSFRIHSKKELENKIKLHSTEDCAQYAADKMEELGLLNDLEFSKAYAKEMSSRKYYSLNRIKYELLKKGVNKSLILEALNEVEMDEELNIKKFIEVKYHGKIDDEKVKRRAVSALQRLGYNWSQISAIVNMKDYTD